MDNKIINLLQQLGFTDYKKTPYSITYGVDMRLNGYYMSKDFHIGEVEAYFTLSKYSNILITTKDKDKFYDFLREEFKTELRKIKIENVLK